MRVIAGEARGRSLEALPGTDVTRPTLSQVKEAMFSIVQFDLPGARVLDLYAGSGQLGIEALSRGAARCVFLDENREAVNIIMRNCKACGVFDRSRVNIGEAARYLSACREQFDIVLLDPPFRNGTLEKILPLPEVERHSRQLHAGNTQHTGLSISVVISWMRFTTVTAVCITKSPCTADHAGHCPARCG